MNTLIPSSFNNNQTKKWWRSRSLNKLKQFSFRLNWARIYWQQNSTSSFAWHQLDGFVNRINCRSVEHFHGNRYNNKSSTDDGLSHRLCLCGLHFNCNAMRNDLEMFQKLPVESFLSLAKAKTPHKNLDWLKFGAMIGTSLTTLFIIIMPMDVVKINT